MLLSLNQMFSDQQAITTTAPSTNHIDLGVKKVPYGAVGLDRDQGKGNKICLLVQVTEDFNTLTSITFAIEQDSDSGFGGAEVLLQQTVLLADLKAGKQLNFDVIPKGSNKQFLRMNYTVAGTPATLGKVSAGISLGNQTNG